MNKKTAVIALLLVLFAATITIDVIEANFTSISIPAWVTVVSGYLPWVIICGGILVSLTDGKGKS